MITTLDYSVVFEEWAEKFNFFPDCHGDSLGINEPDCSFTIQYDKFLEEDIVQLNEVIMAALIRLGFPILRGLDWQHGCYDFDPHEDINNLPLSVFPDGDYYVISDKSYSNGTFGHPWRSTICIWGSDLTKAVIGNLPSSFSKIIRINGKNV